MTLSLFPPSDPKHFPLSNKYSGELLKMYNELYTINDLITSSEEYILATDLGRLFENLEKRCLMMRQVLRADAKSELELASWYNTESDIGYVQWRAKVGIGTGGERVNLKTENPI